MENSLQTIIWFKLWKFLKNSFKKDLERGIFEQGHNKKKNRQN